MTQVGFNIAGISRLLGGHFDYNQMELYVDAIFKGNSDPKKTNSENRDKRKSVLKETVKKVQLSEMTVRKHLIYIRKCIRTGSIGTLEGNNPELGLLLSEVAEKCEKIAKEKGIILDCFNAYDKSQVKKKEAENKEDSEDSENDFFHSIDPEKEAAAQDISLKGRSSLASSSSESLYRNNLNNRFLTPSTFSQNSDSSSCFGIESLIDLSNSGSLLLSSDTEEDLDQPDLLRTLSGSITSCFGIVEDDCGNDAMEAPPFLEITSVSNRPPQVFSREQRSTLIEAVAMQPVQVFVQPVDPFIQPQSSMPQLFTAVEKKQQVTPRKLYQKKKELQNALRELYKNPKKALTKIAKENNLGRHQLSKYKAVILKCIQKEKEKGALSDDEIKEICNENKKNRLSFDSVKKLLSEERMYLSNPGMQAQPDLPSLNLGQANSLSLATARRSNPPNGITSDEEMFSFDVPDTTILEPFPPLSPLSSPPHESSFSESNKELINSTDLDYTYDEDVLLEQPILPLVAAIEVPAETNSISSNSSSSQSSNESSTAPANSLTSPFLSTEAGKKYEDNSFLDTTDLTKNDSNNLRTTTVLIANNGDQNIPVAESEVPLAANSLLENTGAGLSKVVREEETVSSEPISECRPTAIAKNNKRKVGSEQSLAVKKSKAKESEDSDDTEKVDSDVEMEIVSNSGSSASAHSELNEQDPEKEINKTSDSSDVVTKTEKEKADDEIGGPGIEQDGFENVFVLINQRQKMSIKEISKKCGVSESQTTKYKKIVTECIMFENNHKREISDDEIKNLTCVHEWKIAFSTLKKILKSARKPENQDIYLNSKIAKSLGVLNDDDERFDAAFAQFHEQKCYLLKVAKEHGLNKSLLSRYKTAVKLCLQQEKKTNKEISDAQINKICKKTRLYADRVKRILLEARKEENQILYK